jgi:CHAT domain-containing protein/tetratricopeptide (TPR) repeat protein
VAFQTAAQNIFSISIGNMPNVCTFMGAKRPFPIHSNPYFVLMKNLTLFLVLLFGAPCFLGAQVVDTLAIRSKVDSLLQVSRKYTFSKKHEDAFRIIQTATTVAENAFGNKNNVYAYCFYIKGWTFQQINKLTQAEECYRKALSISKEATGEFHLAYAFYLRGLADFYFDSGDYKKAEEWFTESLSINEKIVGTEHVEYLASQIELAATLAKMNQYEKAELLLKQAKETFETKIKDLEHHYYRSCLNKLSHLYASTGKYELSESIYLKVLSLKTFEDDPEGYAYNLSGLADLYLTMDNYKKAEPVFIEALTIWENMHGKESRSYAHVQNGLAVLYMKTSNYEKAELLQLENSSIWEKIAGKEHPEYGASLNNLSIIYNHMGNYKKAEQLLIETKNIWEKVFGKEHERYAMMLTNLAALYTDMGAHQKSKPLYFESLSIREKIFGKEHPDYAARLHSIATLYFNTGEYEKSKNYYTEALKIRKKSIGERHPDYAISINGLAQVYYEIGDYQKAEALSLEAKSIQEKSLGVEHPEYIESLNDIAKLYMKTKDHEKAEPVIHELIQANHFQVLKSAKHLSEDEINIFSNTLTYGRNLAMSFTQVANSQGAANMSFNSTLFEKGFLSAFVNKIHEYALLDSITVSQFNLQKSYLRRLSSEYSKPIAERDSARIAEWEEKANAIEKELVRTVAGYSDLIRQVSWEEVKRQLRPTEAAVELVSYRYYTPKPTDSTMYAALVLLPTDTAPHFIPLFEERQLQALFNRPGFDEPLTVKGLYAPNSDLLNLLWKPLESLLRDAKTIYYSPAGLLHGINPAALRSADKRYLSEDRQWVRVGSTRELVTGRLADRSFARTEEGADAEALIIGGVRYDMDSLVFAATNPLDTGSQEPFEIGSKDGKFRYMVEEGLPNRPTGLRGGGDDDGWEPLPGSAREVEQLDTLLQKSGFLTEVLTGYTASEEHIKSIGKTGPSPRILHVATHGFAYPDPKKEPQQNFIGQELVYKLHDDPMLRSGLILAGANHYWTNKRPLENHEDGVLVAYEVRDLNLRNTELAVLSACQTGLGDVVGSEGVYGLQRAFRIAGAKFLIVSLWHVPDEQTRELMRLFYENWTEKGESLRDAFNHAQATLREHEPNPYMWAGFVLIE